MVYTLSGMRLPTVPSVNKLGGTGSSSRADRRNAHLSFLSKNQSHSCTTLLLSLFMFRPDIHLQEDNLSVLVPCCF